MLRLFLPVLMMPICLEVNKQEQSCAVSQLGGILSQLETLNLNQHRKMLSGKNRVIYEVRQDAVYTHLIVDVRRALKEVLMQRLLR